MDTLVGSLGQLGPIGVALIILIVMWGLNKQTRSEHAKQIAYYREEIARKDTEHDNEIAGLRAEVSALRNEIKGLREDLAREFKARMAAEETAHKLRMRGRQ